MKTIYLKKFGNILLSRPSGLEAFNAIRPDINPLETIEIDFEGVLTVAPSWLDEFLIQLANYTNGNVELLPTENPSVLFILPVLSMARKDNVSLIAKRAIKRMDSLKK